MCEFGATNLVTLFPQKSVGLASGIIREIGIIREKLSRRFTLRNQTYSDTPSEAAEATSLTDMYTLTPY